MQQNAPIGRFTHEIMKDGMLEELLERLPAHELAPAIAAIARDRGYCVRIEEIRSFLAGADVRLA